MMSVVTDSYKRQEGYWYPATECGREAWRGEGALALMTHLQTPFSSPAISVVPAKPFVASGAVNQLAANLQSDDLLWWSPSRKGLPTTGSLCSRIGTKGLSKASDGLFEHISCGWFPNLKTSVLLLSVPYLLFLGGNSSNATRVLVSNSEEGCKTNHKVASEDSCQEHFKTIKILTFLFRPNNWLLLFHLNLNNCYSRNHILRIRIISQETPTFYSINNPKNNCSRKVPRCSCLIMFNRFTKPR